MNWIRSVFNHTHVFLDPRVKSEDESGRGLDFFKFKYTAVYLSGSKFKEQSN